MPFRVSTQAPPVVRVPGTRPFTGAMALELDDESGKRIAANYVNLYAQSSSSPRVEVLGPRLSGFLSSMERYHYASYGYASRVSAPAPAGDIELRLEGDHGLAVYGEGMGRYGADPVILVNTTRDLSHPTGWRQ